jgi:hypothetical protein
LRSCNCQVTSFSLSLRSLKSPACAAYMVEVPQVSGSGRRSSHGQYDYVPDSRAPSVVSR